MKGSNRFINIFGSKCKSSWRYPSPIYDTLIEPACGGAGYSLLHYTKQVYLYDINPEIVNAWDYIIKATPEEVLALPLIEKDQLVSELKCSEGGRLAISWCLNQLPRPAKKLSSWGVFHNERGAACYWGEARRKQMAVIASMVKHWKVELKDYREVPNRRASWFFDFPYQDTDIYKHKGINYEEAAEYCKSREGQVIVAEREGAIWLPFNELIYEGPTQKRFGQGTRKRHRDVMYYQET